MVSPGRTPVMVRVKVGLGAPKRRGGVFRGAVGGRWVAVGDGDGFGEGLTEDFGLRSEGEGERQSQLAVSDELNNLGAVGRARNQRRGAVDGAILCGGEGEA